MTCWHCGRTITLATAQKVLTRDVCPQCDSDLHCCRNCRHFDPTSHNECREVMAEWVRYKEKNNYCDYFAPADAAAGVQKSDARDAKSRFDQLFKN